HGVIVLEDRISLCYWEQVRYTLLQTGQHELPTPACGGAPRAPRLVDRSTRISDYVDCLARLRAKRCCTDCGVAFFAGCSNRVAASKWTLAAGSPPNHWGDLDEAAPGTCPVLRTARRRLRRA